MRLSIIRGGALQKAGIEEIGIAGYPKPHPRIPVEAIDASLRDKIAAARSDGLSLHIVSQFCFEPATIVSWLTGLRSQGIGVPVKIGVAGPTSLPALLRYAKHCGVRASMRGLMSGVAAGLAGRIDPATVIDPLVKAGDALGDVALHYFSFGGAVPAAQYAHDKSVDLAARCSDTSRVMRAAN